MFLNIITNPNPVLRQVAKELKKEEIKSEKIQNLIRQMIPSMYLKDGVGLAAPQVGESLRIFIIAKEYTEKKEKDIILINPKWKRISPFTEWDNEGCLSVSDIYGSVRRYKKVRVTGLDENGQEVDIKASGFFARIIQHESDHLDGVLFIDKAKNLHTVYRE